MNISVSDILHTLERLAPSHLAESWDNVGLLVGNPENTVCSILIGLDPTNTLIDEAITLGADTIITHHPVIFKPLPSIHTNDPCGRLLQKALKEDISIIGCHTNFDSAEDGVNDVLARLLGLTDLTPLQQAPGEDGVTQGLGRIGTYTEPLERAAFIARTLEALQLESLMMAGSLPDTITTVALCGGSGSEFAPLAKARGADVYLSAEIKHSTAIWANETGFAVIDGTHYATEKPATAALVKALKNVARKQNWPITIQNSGTEQHPLVPINKTFFLK